MVRPLPAVSSLAPADDWELSSESDSSDDEKWDQEMEWAETPRYPALSKENQLRDEDVSDRYSFSEISEIERHHWQELSMQLEEMDIDCSSSDVDVDSLPLEEMTAEQIEELVGSDHEMDVDEHPRCSQEWEGRYLYADDGEDEVSSLLIVPVEIPVDQGYAISDEEDSSDDYAFADNNRLSYDEDYEFSDDDLPVSDDEKEEKTPEVPQVKEELPQVKVVPFRVARENRTCYNLRAWSAMKSTIGKDFM